MYIQEKPRDREPGRKWSMNPIQKRREYFIWIFTQCKKETYEQEYFTQINS